MTAFPITVSVTWFENEFKVNETKIPESGYCIIKNKAEEEILLVIAKENVSSLKCGKMAFPKERIVAIGADFRNEIFYEYSAFLKDKELRIYRENEKYFLERKAQGEEKAEVKVKGIYVNGVAAGEKVMLEKGDKVEIFGLCIRVLPEMLICTSFYGTLRMAERKEEIPISAKVSVLRKEASYGEQKSSIRECVREGSSLHIGEMELEKPQPLQKQSEPPLFLTIGPSFTMIIPVILMMLVGSMMAGGGSAGSVSAGSALAGSTSAGNALAGSVSTGGTAAGSVTGQSMTSLYGMTAVMTMASAFLSVFWSIMNRSYRKKKSREEANKREKEYREYLKQTDGYLSVCLRENRQILLKKYPSLNQIMDEKEGMIFWQSKRGFEERFIRLGIGSIPFTIKLKVPGKSRLPSHDRLLDEACELAEKYQELPEVPVGISMEQSLCVGFTGEEAYTVFLQFLIQLAAGFGRREMKLVYFYNENDREQSEIAGCIKWMPQIWQAGKRRRFLAGNGREAGEILPSLTELLHNRIEEKNAEDFYVIAVSDRRLVKNEGIYKLLTGVKAEGNYTALFVEKRKENLPGSCDSMVVAKAGKTEIFHYEKEKADRQEAREEAWEQRQAERYVRRLSGCNLGIFEEENALPEKVSFLDLYGCKQVKELHCMTRWQENKAGERISVPIGFGEGRKLLSLDIHEKFHGPHGLVAGTTGSGKSELLQTYLLSLSVSFGPEDVNFFIIDYKGGGMGHVLEKLPHCAGVISNLSGRQIKRALLSLKSENTRRQQLFGQAGVSHVDEYAALYAEGKVKEPVPHLILVVDEFAELKKEEPDFMQEIISTAQIGRSLGVHLILATQKPAGTVDDKIWSNTRFRLCLRVADKQDSMDMLHRPEAVNLVNAGRCFLQVGNNEVFEKLQTGYGKAAYGEEESKEAAVLVTATGKRLYGKKEKTKKSLSQLEAVTDYVNQCADRLGFSKAGKLWMEELPERLVLGDMDIEKKDREKRDVEIVRKGKPEEKSDVLRMSEEKSEMQERENDKKIRFCLGKYDDPGRQRQAALFYEPLEEGHLCLCGMPSTGKSTFLQTLLWQISKNYTPRELLFVMAAADSAGISCFEKMPHCIGSIKNVRDGESFFYHLKKFLEDRKKLLKGVNFLQYRKKQKKPIPSLLILIDNYGTFRQMTEDGYEEFLERLAREGLQYGIYLIITALGTGSGELPGRLFEKLKTVLTLEMSDKVQYGDAFRQYQIPVCPTPNIKGRGLCKTEGRILEFQVPLLSDKDDYERVKEIEALAHSFKEKQNAFFAGGGKESMEFFAKFPRIPESSVYADLLKEWKKEKNGELVIGYQLQTGLGQSLSLAEHFPFLISGERNAGKKNAIACIMRGLSLLAAEIVLYDRAGGRNISGKNMADRIISTGEDFVKWCAERWQGKTLSEKELKAEEKQEKGCQEEGAQEKEIEKVCLVIADLADFVQMLAEQSAFEGEIIRNFEKEVKEKKVAILAVSLPGRESELMGSFFYELFIRKQCGIHLGGNAASQRLLSFEDLSYAQLGKKEETGIGYLKLGPGTESRRILMPKFEKDEVKDDFSGCTDTGPGSDL